MKNLMAMKGWLNAVGSVPRRHVILALLTAGFMLLQFAIMASEPVRSDAYSVGSDAYSNFLYTIRDNATGGDCNLIGSWNPANKTCTVGWSFSAPAISYGGGHKSTIEIASDGVTLDGVGHTISANGAPQYGVYLFGRKNVTVKNLVLQNYANAVFINAGEANTVSGVTGRIFLQGTSKNVLSGNEGGMELKASDRNSILNSRVHGLFKLDGKYNRIAGNDIFSSDAEGIGLYGFSNLMENNRVGGTPYTGIAITGSDNTVRNNIVSGNRNYMDGWGGSVIGIGIRLGKDARRNMILANTVTQNGCGININSSYDNVIKDNVITDNSWGFLISEYTYSSGNLIYHNRIERNYTAAENRGSGSGNKFNLSAPIGGNFWGTDFNYGYGNSWHCTNNNGDDFCDNAFAKKGMIDELPWAAPNWPQPTAGKPAMGLLAPRAFWASYDDYQNRILSVAWTIKNKGSAPAYNVKVTGMITSHGVQVIIPATVAPPWYTPPGFWPKYYGDLDAAQSATQTFRYRIPEGVTRWRTDVFVEAKDAKGSLFTYPK